MLDLVLMLWISFEQHMPKTPPPKLIISIVTLRSYLNTASPCFASYTVASTLGYSTPPHMWIPAVNSENYGNFIRTKRRLQRKWARLPTKFTLLILLLKHIQMNAVFMAYCFVCRWYSNVHCCLKIVLKSYEELCYYKCDLQGSCKRMVYMTYCV